MTGQPTRHPGGAQRVDQRAQPVGGVRRDPGQHGADRERGQRGQDRDTDEHGLPPRQRTEVDGHRHPGDRREGGAGVDQHHRPSEPARRAQPGRHRQRHRPEPADPPHPAGAGRPAARRSSARSRPAGSTPRRPRREHGQQGAAVDPREQRADRRGDEEPHERRRRHRLARLPLGDAERGGHRGEQTGREELREDQDEAREGHDADGAPGGAVRTGGGGCGGCVGHAVSLRRGAAGYPSDRPA